jgi:HEAT repeat protein
MLIASNWLLDPGGASLLVKAIAVSLAGIIGLQAFIFIRRAVRRMHFKKHDALVFKTHRQWSGIMAGVPGAQAWRQDPMQREIVLSNVLQEIESASPKKRIQLQEFLRSNGLLDICIERARRVRGWRRRQALVTLGAMQMPEAIATLAGALDDPDLETRIAAIRGLGRTGLPQAAEPVLERLIVARLNVPNHPIINALVRCTREDSSRLLFHLRQAQGEVRELLSRVAGEIATQEMADEMIALAGDPAAEVRASAARSLRVAPLPLALPTLASLARDAVWFVRLRAVAGLDELRHPRTIPILLEAVRDPNRLVRIRAAASLSHFTTESANILEKIVETRDRYALHAMISALELAGGFEKVMDELSDPLLHDAAAEHLLDALRKGAAGLWVAVPPEPALEKVHA